MMLFGMNGSGNDDLGIVHSLSYGFFCVNPYELSLLEIRNRGDAQSYNPFRMLKAVGQRDNSVAP